MSTKNAERNSAIMAELEVFRSSVPVAKKFGLTDARIRQIAKENGFVFPRRLSLIERIYDKCQWNGTCLEWMGASDQHGYGQCRLKGKTFRVTRIMLEFTCRRQFHGLDILHRCDNPKCVNPDHLYAGTEIQNMRDMSARNRCGKLTAEQILYVRTTDKSNKELAQELRVSRNCIERTRNGQTWKSHPMPNEVRRFA